VVIVDMTARRILQLTGLDQVVPVYDDVQQSGGSWPVTGNR
jgi:hypothetical protein